VDEPFTLATWNVNSLKARGAHVLDWLRRANPTVLGLQELKMQEEDYPEEVFLDAGWVSEVHGQKTYNGVALLSLDPLEDVARGLPEHEGDPQARVLSARLGEVRLINLYVPNGESVDSEKFAYKRRWLDGLARHLENAHDPAEPLAIFGDMNIAPADLDVFDPSRFREQVLFSDEEHRALQRLCDWGLIDLFRHLHPEEKAYSWWDYRAGAWPRDHGARIDLILVTEPLARRAVSCVIDREPRGWDRPSDHTPVLATFAGA
jgi:exodeoxyribonuclease III